MVCCSSWKAMFILVCQKVCIGLVVQPRVWCLPQVGLRGCHLFLYLVSALGILACGGERKFSPAENNMHESLRLDLAMLKQRR